ncbi:MAG: TonB-dependent receptor [Asticcacaulis sp.]
MTALSGAAFAQTTDTAQAADSTVVVVTGIRSSLRSSMNIKRTAQGVVDSISAEDIGKFPDTNLAESLQRITGVSIDRSNGEGSFVTVRGFGPEFNLVTLNGRQMPTATLGDGASAPSSRSFDFANLASEGVAGVDVYKSGRATVDSGGIGSTINIRTPRPFDKPGLRGSIGVKAVDDTSQNSGTDVTPEVSGIISDTFADNKFGVLLTGSYQKRNSSSNDFSAGWRDGYLGSENNWGSLAQPGTPGAANITNRPDPTDVYQVQQNGAYDIHDIERERLNGQLVLQFRPVDNLTATVDYTYSKNKVKDVQSSGGVWFNFNDTSSSWADGPVAGPVFYTERFRADENKDLSYSGSLTANQTENKSTGINLKWQPTDKLSVVLDAHSSTAESKPDSPYGSNMSVGTAIFGIKSQTIDYTTDLPVMSWTMYPGIDSENFALVTPTGQAFRNAYFKDEINQVQLRGHYEVTNWGNLESIDFGVSQIDNKVRSAFGYLQNDTWGGIGPASDVPDDIFHLVSLPDKFDGLSGASSAGMPQNIIAFDLPAMVNILESKYHACSHPASGTPLSGCLAQYSTDRHIHEKTVAPYVQFNTKFELFERPAHVVVGVRYETTDVDSQALVPTPVSSAWVAANEFDLSFNGSEVTDFKGHYQELLPNIDFDFRPMENVVVRASASTTITRPDYASMQGGRSLDTLFRIGGGTGSQGNPGLLPYKSNNIDLSAEWYYGKDSYVSLGYFHKDVSNFITQSRFDTTAFGMKTPYLGPRYNAAVAAVGATGNVREYMFEQYTNQAKTALGGDPSYAQIRDYVNAHFPTEVKITGDDYDSGHNFTGNIIALPSDPDLNFQISTFTNSSQKAELKGVGIQHPAHLRRYRLRRHRQLYQGRWRRHLRRHQAGELLPVRPDRPERQRQRGCLLRQERHPGADRLQLARQVPQRRRTEPDLHRRLWSDRRQRQLGVQAGRDGLRRRDQPDERKPQGPSAGRKTTSPLSPPAMPVRHRRAYDFLIV